jgi:hypothetical protein
MRTTVVLLLFLLLAGPTQAGLITSAGSITSPTVVDFSQFTTTIFGPGPTQVGGLVGDNIVYASSNSSTNGGAIVGPLGHYGLGSNGFWNGAKTGTSPMSGITGLNSGTGTIVFNFNSGPVSQVGGFINYSPGSGPDVFITALGAGDTVLESYDVNLMAPISTPGATSAGAFLGISRPSADIEALQLSNSFVALDNLTFNEQPSTTPAVPEPMSLGLCAAALATLQTYCLVRHKCRQAAKTAAPAKALHPHRAE